MLKYLYEDPDADDALDAQQVFHHLHHLLHTDGVTGCALVDVRSGAMLAGEQRGDDGLALHVAAAASAQVMRSQQQAAVDAGLGAPVDELLLTAGHHQQLLRTLPRRRELFLLALMDGRHANIALARSRIADAQRELA